jgi:hypothetical protein
MELAASKNSTAQAKSFVFIDTISPHARRDFVALFSIWGTTPSIAAIYDDFNSKQLHYYNNRKLESPSGSHIFQ